MTSSSITEVTYLIVVRGNFSVNRDVESLRVGHFYHSVHTADENQVELVLRGGDIGMRDGLT
jgi:hypothetical protein